MAAPLLVDDLVNQVRSLIDELNQEAIDDSRDILPVLNRAQDIACSIFARHYEDPLVVEKIVQTVGGQFAYPMPEDAFEDRLEKIEVIISGTYREVKRLSYRDATNYQDTLVQHSVPIYYVIKAREYHLIPVPTGLYSVRLHYLKEPEKLVKQQGQITLINSGSNYLRVTAPGTDISAAVDDLASYVNIVDAQTGEIKATLQIQSIVGDKITFRSTPTRSVVLNKDVSSSIPVDIEIDDYLAPVQGTCIPFFKKPAYNFYVQYAANELLRKLGTNTPLDEQIVENFEAFVQKTWAGRETTLRVRRISKIWRENRRRWIVTEP